LVEIERMSTAERTRTIRAVKATPPAALDLRWSDGTRATIDVADVLRDRRFKALRTPAEFGRAEPGEWGHSVEWPGGAGLSADALWLRTLTATGRDDARRFIDWRLRHGLSLAKAAEALGLSRRMVAYYSSGEKPVPRAILLACKGWEAERAA
jgi:Protein of unknown function (DUF2442)